MSVPTVAPTQPASATPASQTNAPPPPSTSTSSSARTAPTKPKQHAQGTRKRKPLRRRGARPDDEDESELAAARPPPPAAGGARADGSDSDSDFVPSPQDDDSDDDDSEGADDEDEHEGATEPRTPASASTEQLAAATTRGTGGAKAKPRKAVLAGPDVPPSWSDAVDAAEEGDSIALPTLDFADLSLDAVQALPAVPLSSTTAPAPGAGAGAGKPLSKKQLALQRREAKSAALKARDPAEWDKQEKERAEREEAKRAAKKERLKEKRKERKAADRAAKEGAAALADDVAPAAASTSSPAPVASAPAPALAPAPAPASSRPAKLTRPVVPSRPSRTGLALGLVSSSPSSPSSPAPAPGPAASTSSAAPVVPTATRQPAFLPRDAQGRPIPHPTAAPRGRGRGRGGLAAGSGRWTGAAQDNASATVPSKSASTPGEWGHGGFDELETERGAHSASVRGGRGGAVRGGRGGALAGRGGSAAMLQSGINPRFAHLPFHPSHRFHPGAQPKPKPAGAPAAAAQEPVAPEATTAAPDDELFRDENDAAKGTQQNKKDVVGVKLPEAPAQRSFAVKGAAAVARAAEQNRSAEKENAPPVPQQQQPQQQVATVAPPPVEARKEPQGASVLYTADPAHLVGEVGSEAHSASAPTAFSPFEQQQVQHEASLPPFPQQVPAGSSFYHVPPHLQQAASAAVQAPYIPRHSSPAYFSPPPHAFFPDQVAAMASSPSATSTPPPPFGATHTPTSAYFLPPRPNKRVEIKAPSRDGQSPAPLRTAVVPAAPDAFEAAQQARISQLVREAEERQHHHEQHGLMHQGQWAQYSDAGASSVGAVAGSSSPVSTRTAFLPGSPVVQQPPVHPGLAPSPFYGALPSQQQQPPVNAPPSSAPMFNTFTHSSHGSFDGASPAVYRHALAPGSAPGPDPYAHFAPPPPPPQQPQQHPLAAHHQQQQQQHFYAAPPAPYQMPPHHPHQQLQHPFQQVYDPHAAALAQAQAQAQAQFYGAPPGAEQGRWY